MGVVPFLLGIHIWVCEAQNTIDCNQEFAHWTGVSNVSKLMTAFKIVLNVVLGSFWPTNFPSKKTRHLDNLIQNGEILGFSLDLKNSHQRNILDCFSAISHFTWGLKSRQKSTGNGTENSRRMATSLKQVLAQGLRRFGQWFKIEIFQSGTCVKHSFQAGLRGKCCTYVTTDLRIFMSTVLKLSGKQTSKAQNYAVWLISSYLVVWPLQVETSILLF